MMNPELQKTSKEYAISLVSAQKFYEALLRKGYDAYLLDTARQNRRSVSVLKR